MSALVSIFPDFRAVWEEETQPLYPGYDGFECRNDSLHSVYRSFLPFIGKASASPRQLERLAALLNEAVAAGGDAENAVATCFFEGLGAGPLRRALHPLLTAQSRTLLGR